THLSCLLPLARVLFVDRKEILTAEAAALVRVRGLCELRALLRRQFLLCLGCILALLGPLFSLWLLLLLLFLGFARAATSSPTSPSPPSPPPPSSRTAIASTAAASSVLLGLGFGFGFGFGFRLSFCLCCRSSLPGLGARDSRCLVSFSTHLPSVLRQVQLRDA